ncbi:hypothetical protein [Hymenobacter sediminis]|nr:hypothetical protein [Hymenobacter sediminis]
MNEEGYYGGFERADIEQLLEVMAADQGTFARMFAGWLLGPDQKASLG